MQNVLDARYFGEGRTAVFALPTALLILVRVSRRSSLSGSRTRLADSLAMKRELLRWVLDSERQISVGCRCEVDGLLGCVPLRYAARACFYSPS